MSGVNKVILVGHLGADPELKNLPSGGQVARLSVATSEQWMKDGQKQEKTEWHRVVVWGKQAETCARYLSKGRQVYVEGRLQTNKVEGQDGSSPRYFTDIVASTVRFLGSGKGGERSSSYDDMGGSGAGPDFGPEPGMGTSEDIPF